MKRWLKLGVVLALLGGAGAGLRADATTSSVVETELAALVAQPRVTVVHLWAPWCGNCKNEMKPEGWGKFVRENPAVKVVFVNIWHKGQDPEPRLTAAGLAGGGEGAPANFLAITHPNASNTRGEKLDTLLGMPVSWVPTTWVFRDGKLRYALNYGEVRFDMLQQMVKDAADKW